MQLEDYFEFENCQTAYGPVERIRFRGSRTDIDVILDAWLEGASPEEIFKNHRPILKLEDVFAAITYYLHNKTRMDAYLESGRELEDRMYQAHLKQEPPDMLARMRALLEARKNATVES